MAPDKIYLNIPKEDIDIFDIATWDTEEIDDCVNVPYIRKDALLDWAKKMQYDSTTIVADDFWQIVIDKLNSF